MPRLFELAGPHCPYCLRPAELVDASEVYRLPGFGRLWLCRTPGCDSYVGAHPDGTPKGTLAGPTVRRARQFAHRAFDGWWKAAGWRRRTAYRRLAEAFGVPVVHIGEMDVSDCLRVIALVKEWQDDETRQE